MDDEIIYAVYWRTTHQENWQIRRLKTVRYDVSYFDICSCDCDTCMIHDLCTNPKEDVHSMGESDWKKWLNEETKE